MPFTDDGCPRDDRDPYNLENIPDEVIERVTRIVLEEVFRYFQLVDAGKDPR